MMYRSTALAFAAMLPFAGIASAQGVDGDKLRICAGSQTGNYTFAAQEIATRAAGAFGKGVEVVTTNGSLDNLRRLSAGTCDAAFTQSDVLEQYKIEVPQTQNATSVLRAEVYKEYVHLLCPVSSGWTRINHVGQAAQSGKPARIIVGPDGTGTAESWRAMRRADDALYGKIERLADAPGRTALAQVRDTNNTCMFWISGLNSGDMQYANSMSANNPKRQPTMTLVNFNDRDIINLKGAGGQPLYERASIDRIKPSKNNPGRYANIMTDSSVDVLTVKASLIVNKAWQQAAGPGKTDRLMTAIEDAGPTIWAKVRPAE